jgi:hypothetical protein
LALVLSDILVAQREMLTIVSTESATEEERPDEPPWELLDAQARIAARFDQAVHRFGDKLNIEHFSDLVQRSLGSAEENGGHERERILREIAAEHNTTPFERP